MGFIRTLLFAIVLLAVMGAAFVMSGVYGIGADEPHWDITSRAIDTLRDRSIATHARAITVPNLEDPHLLAEGAQHYAAMCTGCHLAPGMRDSELRAGLYPQPPSLVEAGVDNPAEAFWIIKHGVKLTAMPAWGRTHSDNEIWALVAFAKKLPQLTPEQYQQMTAGSDEHAHHHHDQGDSGDQHEHSGDSHDQQAPADHNHSG
jgi:mono/diheme cytochrome c family protein